ncbi:ATP-dependent Clp protease proteolytic subunit [Bradyrhizobium septentrionale]|uniref:ATP-dependent Clp protease proteolytic subunit n=1 Tax=Bradyrhizobium septentrionale TaxID=1404411 RepID=A0A974A6Z3_9BRAD|nr:ATP-dependent Clp protease proteolytic subunit [Bradyrhizobium septentrionale]UGY18607.1 ATP-dependent Clp protease proteolytic subunit [Bradyrhizobium septentrionale]
MHSRRWSGLLACLVPFVLITSNANAAGVTGSVDCDPTTKYCSIKGLTIEGEISDTTTVALSRLIETFGRLRDPSVPSNTLSGTMIRLNSPGGSVTAAMAIGRLLRKNRMTASVNPYASCLSSCVLIYAGAATRLGYNEFARVGIHQPYFQVPNQKLDAETVRKNYDAMLADLRSYLREMNVSERLADEMMKTPPSSVRLLTAEEQESFGLSVIDPVERETSALMEAQNLGLDRMEYNRRDAHAMKTCPLDSSFFSCHDRLMKTGISNLPDLSKFGTPVE